MPILAGRQWGMKEWTRGRTLQQYCWLYGWDYSNPFPLIINDVPPPPLPPVIINNPGSQKLFIIRGEYLLKEFSRAAFKILLKSIKIELHPVRINGDLIKTHFKINENRIKITLEPIEI